MGWTNNKLTKPIGMGDVSVATGIGGPPYSLGNMIASSTIINKMAVYKPVKSSNPGELTYAERKATRFGFGSITSKQLNPFSSPAVLTNDWVYEKPTAGQPNEWFRALDFDGYVNNAVAPIGMMVGRLVYDEKSYIMLLGNSAVNTLGSTWVSGESLSLEELLEGNQDYYGSYIAFILQDVTGGGVNYIITNTTFSSFVSSSYANKTFTLKGNGETETISGLVHPGIPILQSSRSGHTFNIIVCLSVGGAQSGYAYDVYTSGAYTPYSVGFTSGCDRVQTTLGSGAFSMDGTTITAISVTPTDTYIVETDAGMTWHAYSIEIDATFNTTGAAAYSGTMTISGGMSLVTSGKFGPHASTAGTISPGVSTALASRTSGQTKFLFGSGTDNYLWLPVVNGSVVRTSLAVSLDFDTPFTSGHHCTGSTTVYIPA